MPLANRQVHCYSLNASSAYRYSVLNWFSGCVIDRAMKLNAVKKEIVDTDALIERYRSEIADLKRRLAEREKESEVPAKNRRLSAKEVSTLLFR
jgi:hypothetical protein